MKFLLLKAKANWLSQYQNLDAGLFIEKLWTKNKLATIR